MAGIELAAGKHVSGGYPWNSQPLKFTGHEYVFLLHKSQSIITVGDYRYAQARHHQISNRARDSFSRSATMIERSRDLLQLA